ncbi:hypothetical protein [Streptomyces carpinensis]|uniref:PknH-like extracellular domain-containing protein n=1 Tax=Streptomyces carpinensis TaxID=66369 RepID=A0ABV1WD46_9ACTN|nr:hypothetical protein [Streptomyces carpinensis]
MHIASRAARVLTVAALPLVLAACGTTESTSAKAPASPASPATKDPNAGLLTGAQLKKALAPASFFPAGFSSDPSATRDTGDTFVPPATKSPAKPDCTMLEGTAWIGITGVTGVSFAQGDYVNKNTSEEITQEIDAYRGTTAASVLKDVARIATTTCATFTDSGTHTKVRTSGRSTPGLGDEAYTITLTSSAWDNGTTLIAARQGTNLVTVLSTDGHDDGAATAKKLTGQIVASLKTASAKTS